MLVVRVTISIQWKSTFFELGSVFLVSSPNTWRITFCLRVFLPWVEKSEPFPRPASGLTSQGHDLFNVIELAPEQRLDEIDVCQVAIFVANMCGLEWLKDEEGVMWKIVAPREGLDV